MYGHLSITGNNMQTAEERKLRYQFLIPTVPHRHEKLCNLLEVINAQIVPGIGALLYRDNLRSSYREKLQALSDFSTGDYVSILQDDDSIAPDYLDKVLRALESNPDQIGFRVRHTTDGIQANVIHSKIHWSGSMFAGDTYYRDFMYFNPMRREMFQAVRFRGEACDDEWTEDQRALGVVKTEVFIDEHLFYYIRTTSDNWHTLRSSQPMPAEDIPSLPSYPWLNVLLDEV